MHHLKQRVKGTWSIRPTEGRSGRKTVRFLTRELVHSWGGLGMIEKQIIAIPKVANG